MNPISEVIVSLGLERTFDSIWASRFCRSFSPARIAASSALKSEGELGAALVDDWLPGPPDTRLAILSAINRACSCSVFYLRMPETATSFCSAALFGSLRKALKVSALQVCVLSLLESLSSSINHAIDHPTFAEYRCTAFSVAAVERSNPLVLSTVPDARQHWHSLPARCCVSLPLGVKVWLAEITLAFRNDDSLRRAMFPTTRARIIYWRKKKNDITRSLTEPLR